MGLRLFADDLTGALDSAASFVAALGPIPTYLTTIPDMPPTHFAMDTATRDGEPDLATAAAHRLAPALTAGNPAFRKIDSLLRGHVAQEIAASAALFQHVIIAPAFPAQGRITRAGRQYAQIEGGEWLDTGADIVAELSVLGRRVAPGIPGQKVPPGISLWDSVSDAELAAIVAAGQQLRVPPLWCGSAGLATALAIGLGPDASPPRPQLPGPILALVGSDQPIAKAQLASLGPRHRQLADPSQDDDIADRLRGEGALALSPALPTGMPRGLAGARITVLFAELLHRLAGRGLVVGTLFVSGGATLRGLALALGAQRLDVDGALAPGVPTSLLRGGAWEGQRIVSKSGAFGDSGFLARLFG